MILIIIFAVQFRRTRNKSTPVVNEPTTFHGIQFGSAKRNGDIDWNITESGQPSHQLSLMLPYLYMSVTSPKESRVRKRVLTKINRI